MGGRASLVVIAILVVVNSSSSQVPRQTQNLTCASSGEDLISINFIPALRNLFSKALGFGFNEDFDQPWINSSEWLVSNVTQGGSLVGYITNLTSLASFGSSYDPEMPFFYDNDTGLLGSATSRCIAGVELTLIQIVLFYQPSEFFDPSYYFCTPGQGILQLSEFDTAECGITCQTNNDCQGSCQNGSCISSVTPSPSGTSPPQPSNSEQPTSSATQAPSPVASSTSMTFVPPPNSSSNTSSPAASTNTRSPTPSPTSDRNSNSSFSDVCVEADWIESVGLPKLHQDRFAMVYCVENLRPCGTKHHIVAVQGVFDTYGGHCERLRCTQRPTKVNGFRATHMIAEGDLLVTGHVAYFGMASLWSAIARFQFNQGWYLPGRNTAQVTLGRPQWFPSMVGNEAYSIPSVPAFCRISGSQ
uniref:Uncharacterized protein n=1 Tax=Compsopogon caeruleus TaxID=31354 RepID=A0A7S1XH12_9RHOD